MQTRTFFGEVVGERAHSSTDMEAWLAGAFTALTEALRNYRNPQLNGIHKVRITGKVSV